jgi:tetratricopeptide (TPR) repeat protein
MTPTVDQSLEDAETAFEQGAFDQACTCAEAVLERHPDHADALEIKAMALGEMGEWAEAESIFEAILRRSPHRMPSLLAAADLKIRVSHEEPERIEAGLMLLKRAEREALQSPEASIELRLLQGMGSAQLGEFDDARRAFETVLSLDAEHHEAQLELAIVLFESGDFSRAQALLEQLADSVPDEPWVFHYRGLLAERQGKSPERWFEAARGLDPEEFPRPLQLSPAEFQKNLAAALQQLPPAAQANLPLVEFSVKLLPSDEEVRGGISPSALGSWSETPHAKRGTLTLYQRNLERFAATPSDVCDTIQLTVVHEAGHALGLDPEMEPA